MKKILYLAFVSLAITQLNAQERMISAGFGVTEIIYALDAQDKLVAADFSSRQLIKDEDISQLGLHLQLSVEQVMQLNPTHLIGTDEMGPQTTIEKIAERGVEVVTLPSGQDIPQLLSRIDALSEVVGHLDEAKKLKQTVTLEIKKLERKQCKNKPNAIFLLLDHGPTSISGTDTAIHSIITLAGGDNSANQNFSGYYAISMKAILEIQPDYILVSKRSWDVDPSADNILEKLPILKSTPAGINKNIVFVPSGALLGGFGLSSIKVAKKLNSIFCPQ